MNIQGNERADAAAKSAVSLPITNMKLPPCELIYNVSKFLSVAVAGYMGRVTHFTLSTLLLAVLRTTKAHPVMTQYSSIDSELVTVI